MYDRGTLREVRIWYLIEQLEVVLFSVDERLHQDVDVADLGCLLDLGECIFIALHLLHAGGNRSLVGSI